MRRVGVAALVIASCRAATPMQSAPPPPSIDAAVPVVVADAGDDDCPDVDTDGDGFPDRCDRCPDQPARTVDGCPIITLDVLTIRLPAFVSFEPNGLKPTFGEIALQAVPYMKEARFRRIGIVGHSLPSEKGTLAMRRAEIVKKELVGRGVDAAKLELRAAPPGDLRDCPTGDAGATLPCVTFAVVEIDSLKLEWDGSRYVEPPPPPRQPLPCPDRTRRQPGQPCK